MKEVYDQIEDISYYGAVISDSKLSLGSPWTDNQKSELIDIFKKDKTKEFIEYEVRSDIKYLGNLASDESFKKTQKIRIYRDDVYKIISEGDNYKAQ